MTTIFFIYDPKYINQVNELKAFRESPAGGAYNVETYEVTETDTFDSLKNNVISLYNDLIAGNTLKYLLLFGSIEEVPTKMRNISDETGLSDSQLNANPTSAASDVSYGINNDTVRNLIIIVGRLTPGDNAYGTIDELSDAEKIENIQNQIDKIKSYETIISQIQDYSYLNNNSMDDKWPNNILGIATNEGGPSWLYKQNEYDDNGERLGSDYSGKGILDDDGITHLADSEFMRKELKKYNDKNYVFTELYDDNSIQDFLALYYLVPSLYPSIYAEIVDGINDENINDVYTGLLDKLDNEIVNLNLVDSDWVSLYNIMFDENWLSNLSENEKTILIRIIINSQEIFYGALVKPEENPTYSGNTYDENNTSGEYGPYQTDVISKINGDDEHDGGTSLLLYTGHSSETTFSTTSFNVQHVDQLTNKDKYFLCCVVGCSAGSHDENYMSLCEKFITAKDKGSIASFCSTVLMGWTPGMYLQRKLNDEILAATEVKTIGELFKTSVQIDDFKTSTDFFHYHILGDPATRFVLTLPETRNFINSFTSNIDKITPNNPTSNIEIKFNRNVSEFTLNNFEVGQGVLGNFQSNNNKIYTLDYTRGTIGNVDIDTNIQIINDYKDKYNNTVDESATINMEADFLKPTVELKLGEYPTQTTGIYKFDDNVTIIAEFNSEVLSTPKLNISYGDDDIDNINNISMRAVTEEEKNTNGYMDNTYIHIYSIPPNIAKTGIITIENEDEIKDNNGNVLDTNYVNLTLEIDSIQPTVELTYDLVKNVYIPGENIEITAKFTKNMQFTEQNKPTISFTKDGETTGPFNMTQVSGDNLKDFKYNYTVQEVTTRGNIDILIRGKDIVGNEVEFTNIIDVCSECVIVNISYDKDTFYKQGETVVIEATFNDILSESPEIKITGEKIVESPQIMTKKDDYIYTYNYTIPRNMGGQVIVSFENVKKEINGKILEIISDNIEKSGAIFMVTPSLISYSIDKTKFTPKSREAVLTLTFTNSVTFTTSDIFAIYGRFFNIIRVDDYTYNVSYLAPLGLQQDVEILIMGTYFDIVGNTGPSSTDLNLHLFVKVNTFEPPCVKLANCCSCTPKVIVKKNTVMDIQGSNTSRAMRLAAALASGKKSTLRAIVSRNC